MSEKKNDSIPNIKVILLGEMAVGKTNLINAYCDRDFISHTCPTNSPEFSQRKIKIENKKYFIDLWDTAGQERYHSMTKIFIKGAQIITEYSKLYSRMHLFPIILKLKNTFHHKIL